MLSSPPDVLWLLFVVYWVVTARRGGKPSRRDDGRVRFATNALLLTGGVLVFGHAVALGPLDARFVGELAPERVVANLLILAGLALAVWARAHLGRYWTGDVGVFGGHQIVESGPYSRIRHPIYTGVLVAIVGTAMWTGEVRALLGALCLMIGLLSKARREEGFMLRELGAPYAHYRERTGFIFPRLGGG